MPRQQMGVRFLWRQLYSLPVVVGDVGKLLPPGAVDRVCEPGMVRIELGAVRQDLKTDMLSDTN